jgi:hypothetical protein
MKPLFQRLHLYQIKRMKVYFVYSKLFTLVLKTQKGLTYLKRYIFFMACAILQSVQFYSFTLISLYFLIIIFFFTLISFLIQILNAFLCLTLYFLFVLTLSCFFTIISTHLILIEFFFSIICITNLYRCLYS